MQVDPIVGARAVAQHGGAASPRGISDAAAARASEESRFEKLRRERLESTGSPVRALVESDATESRIARSEGESQADLGVQNRRFGDRDSDDQGRVIDYSV